MSAKPETIDASLATVSSERRVVLEKLRKTTLSVLPDAEECISYSMPAFRYAGHVVAGFLATSKGCSYFPFSGTTLATLAADVKKYDRTKSALHFDPKAHAAGRARAQAAQRAHRGERGQRTGDGHTRRARQTRSRAHTQSRTRRSAVTPSTSTVAAPRRSRSFFFVPGGPASAVAISW